MEGGDNLSFRRSKRRRLVGFGLSEAPWRPPTPTSIGQCGDIAAPNPEAPDSTPLSGRKVQITVVKSDFQVKQEAFATLITKDPVILAFHRHDVCFGIADNYLVAIVFVYFVRCRFSPEEFTRHNYFLCLYLAHHAHEEDDENRWEILPWAIGRHWSTRMRDFFDQKNKIFVQMDFRGLVSRNLCEKIMALRRFRDLEPFQRVRLQNHGDVIAKKRPKFKEAYYTPCGPMWHYRNSKFEVKISKIKRERADGRACPVCGLKPEFDEEMKRLCLVIRDSKVDDENNVLDISEGLDEPVDEEDESITSLSSGAVTPAQSSMQKVPDISPALSSINSSPMFTQSPEEEARRDYSELLVVISQSLEKESILDRQITLES